MSKGLLNTPFESMLRLLLLLATLDKGLDVDHLAFIDFLSIYGKTLNILNDNLNGDNNYSLSEFSLKRRRMMQAVLLGLRNGYLRVLGDGEGLCYSISNEGRQFIMKNKSQYAVEYCENVKRVYEKMKDRSLLDYFQIISSTAKQKGEG